MLNKIFALKSQNKSIEDIYKYTNDIIFEEDDEQTDHRGSDSEERHSKDFAASEEKEHNMRDSSSPSFFKSGAV